MKDKLAKFLVGIARRLAPQRYDNVEMLTGYEPKKLGVAIAISPAEISHYRRNENCTFRKARKFAIKDMKKRVRQSIYLSLVEGSHIEYEVYRQGDDIVVSGHIKIYKRKD